MLKQKEIRKILEAALLAAGRPLSLQDMTRLFPLGSEPDKAVMQKVLQRLGKDYEDRGIELKQVANGYRIQVRAGMSEWLSRLWEERPPRFSRALVETLALIAYRQPITRGEIEEVRGVSVSTNIMRTLLERGWVRVVGHRDVPGRPAVYGSTREFLDYFNLSALDELPTLAELRDIDSINIELELVAPGEDGSAAAPGGGGDQGDDRAHEDGDDRVDEEADDPADRESDDAAVTLADAAAALSGAGAERGSESVQARQFADTADDDGAELAEADGAELADADSAEMDDAEAAETDSGEVDEAEVAEAHGAEVHGAETETRADGDPSVDAEVVTGKGGQTEAGRDATADTTTGAIDSGSESDAGPDDDADDEEDDDGADSHAHSEDRPDTERNSS